MSFPLSFKKPTPIKMDREIKHRLKRKKGEYSTAYISDRLNQLFDAGNALWHNHMKKIEKKGKTYDRNLRVKFAMVKIKNIVIDDDIQRDMDPDHVAKIGNIENFRVQFMAPIQAIKTPGKDEYHAINSQHTLVLEAAYAYHGIWDGYDGDWQEMEVPVTYIETNDRHEGREGFRILNGKGAKKVGKYYDLRMDVLSYRVDGKTDLDYKQAHQLVKICEDNGFEPIPDTDEENAGLPGAITHVSAMLEYKNKPNHWEFILKTHKKYWPNIQLHGMEIDLYGFMYDYFSKSNDVYSTEFERDFLNPFHAIIQQLFGMPDNLGTESTDTFRRWWAKTWDRTIDEAKNKVDAEASFVLMLKLYRKLGGTVALPDIVDLYDNNKAGDLTLFLPKGVLQVVNKYA